MYIAMNRFKIINGCENKFENIWRDRESLLENVLGFVAFNLIKGEKQERHTIYSSHSTWESKAAFVEWTKSENFRRAHRNAGEHKELYEGHPQFEGFEVII